LARTWEAEGTEVVNVLMISVNRVEAQLLLRDLDNSDSVLYDVRDALEAFIRKEEEN
jgi:hypothetical protein